MQQLIENKFLAIKNQLTNIDYQLGNVEVISIEGKVVSAVGTIIIANIINVKIGDMCLIYDPKINLELFAEVVAIDHDGVKLLPFGTIEKISKNALVKKMADNFKIKVGNWLLGKVVNGLGTVVESLLQDIGDDVVEIDSLNGDYYPIMAIAPDPLRRPIITQQLVTGIKVLDLFVTIGCGQRLGIFAAAGMGKTTLMGMILRNSHVDVIIVVLVGERGREVQEFINIELTNEMRQKCVLVIATADRPSVEQLKSVYVGQTIAEYFRDQGKNVLLFVDSITRFARAGREVGLSSGEPPTRGGFTPSVFASFQRLMERAGNNQLGTITAFYTVLMETEELIDDPIADEVKSIIDGHIILSRPLSEAGHFPAINVLNSLSRVADRIIDERHLLVVRKTRQLLSKYIEIEFLLRVGEYKSGSDKLADEAIEKYGSIMNFLQQKAETNCDFMDSLNDLINIVGCE